MADNEVPKPEPAEPASDARKHAVKRVVLSSVAKIAPTDEESLLGEPAPATEEKPSQPPSLPRKPAEEGLIRPVGWTIRPGGTTMIIKLPPKTGTLPRLTSLSTTGTKPETAPPHRHTAPPPLPSKVEEPADGEEESKRPPPVRLQPASPPEIPAGSSVLPPPVAASPTSTSPISPRPIGIRPPPLPVATTPPRAPVPLPPSTIKTTALVSRAVEPPAPAAEPLPTAPTTALPVVAPPATPPSSSEVEALLPKNDAPVPVAVRKPYFQFPPAKKKAPEADTDNPPAASGPSKVLTPPPVPVSSEGLATSASDPVTPTKTVDSTTPPKATPGGAPTLPIRPAGRDAATPARRPDVKDTAVSAGLAGAGDAKTTSQINRAARIRKRRIMGIVAFYVLFVALMPVLYYTSLYFSRETRVEGQVIPPPNTILGNEVWIVTDFRDLATGIASDLAGDRTAVMQEMQEKLDHVQRARADVAAREDRIRLLKAKIKAANDEQVTLVQQARDASQQVWDGPGAQMEQEYQARLTELDQAIRARAKSIGIAYAPDPAFYSPEVWANAFRLGLYEVPKGVDSVKERAWLDQQIKAWRDFTKQTDDKQNALREQAAKLKMAPATQLADLKNQVDELQQRIDGTITEEEPLKAELEQAQTDLAVVQAKEAALDAKPFEKLDALPEANITKRLPLRANGRFSWREVEKESKFSEEETTHAYWLFARAFRADGRQYWSLRRFVVGKDQTALLNVEPQSFVSTKAILRPDLSPDEQAQ